MYKILGIENYSVLYAKDKNWLKDTEKKINLLLKTEQMLKAEHKEFHYFYCQFIIKINKTM